MMKARRIEQETMRDSMPVILKEEEQGWDDSIDLEKVEDRDVMLRWHSNVPGSGATEHVIIAAMQDMENMGYDVSGAEEMIETGRQMLAEGRLADLSGHTARVWNTLMNSPKVDSHPHWHYTIYESFEQMAEKVSFIKADIDTESEDYQRRTWLGWVAQICAGAVGTAIEGYTTENIRKVFGEIYGYPRTPNTYNDDITYELALLRAVEKHGSGVTGADIAEQWVALVPMGWSAEDVALRNLKLGVFPPESGYQSNPYREWIGAQMRGAVCGMLYPGDTRNAARLAFMDGQISHHNSGVLGEVFNAVLTSLAYAESDIRTVVSKAVDLIPHDSEYYSVVRFALDQCKQHTDWESAWRPCEEKYGIYNWIHAFPNAAAEVVALWFGNGDFDETMHISAMQGWDVDCNAAQIGTVAAISTGRELDLRWTDPIGDELNTYMRLGKKMSIKALADETVTLARRLCAGK